MGRLLFFLLIGLLVWIFVRHVGRVAARREAQAQRAAAREPEAMVACARCGVNLPRSEAREEDGRLVCRDNPSCLPRP